MIGSKNTTSLFQIGSKTYKERMGRLKPKNIQELAACLALVRGPCISEKLDEVYMQIVEGKKEVELIHPIYDNVTKNTNVILIYQEQIIQLLNDLGFEPEDSFSCMKAMAKKKVDKVASYKADYDKITSKYMDLEISKRIWNILEVQALYCFNQSHAVAYALICYATAYYKVHYPLEWMAATLTNAYEKKEEIEETIAECRRIGIKFNTLDVNSSVWRFVVNYSLDNTIDIGFCAIKGFGEKAYEAIKQNRPFNSLEDMLEKVPKRELSKTRMIPAIFSGLFNSFGSNIDIYNQYCDYRKEEPSNIIKIARESIDINQSAQDLESFVLTCPLLTSPVNDFTPIGFNNLKRNDRFNIQAIVSRVKKLKDKNGNRMAFLTLETADGLIDSTIFATNYKALTKFMKKGLLVNITAKKDKEDSCIILNIE